MPLRTIFAIVVMTLAKEENRQIIGWSCDGRSSTKVDDAEVLVVSLETMCGVKCGPPHRSFCVTSVTERVLPFCDVALSLRWR